MGPIYNLFKQWMNYIDCGVIIDKSPIEKLRAYYDKYAFPSIAKFDGAMALIGYVNAITINHEDSTLEVNLSYIIAPGDDGTAHERFPNMPSIITLFSGADFDKFKSLDNMHDHVKSELKQLGFSVGYFNSIG